MKQCRYGNGCKKEACRFAHPDQNQLHNPQLVYGWQHYCPMYRPDFQSLPPEQWPQPSPYEWNVCLMNQYHHPGFSPPLQPWVGAQKCAEPAVEIMKNEHIVKQTESLLLASEKNPNKKGRSKEKSPGRKRHQNHHKHSKRYPTDFEVQRLTEEIGGVAVEEQPEFLQQLVRMDEMGFKDAITNKTLLKHFGGNVEEAVGVLVNLHQQPEEDSDLEDMLEVHNNFLILKQLGFLNIFKRHKILRSLYKHHNNLGATLKCLSRKREMALKKHEHKKKLQLLPYNYPVKIEEEIPEGCELMLDGFNIIPTNKHLRKLFFCKDKRYREEAVMRLKILVETLAEGSLVVDKQYLTDLEREEIYASIGVNIDKPKLVKEVCAAPLSADDKIVEMLAAMPVERQRKVLVVTGDHELIQRCLHATNCQCQIMNGKRFIKLAKQLQEKGIRKRILINKSF